MSRETSQPFSSAYRCIVSGLVYRVAFAYPDLSWIYSEYETEGIICGYNPRANTNWVQIKVSETDGLVSLAYDWYAKAEQQHLFTNSRHVRKHVPAELSNTNICNLCKGLEPHVSKLCIYNSTQLEKK